MYIVMTSAARMPVSCWGKYRNVAVVETDGTCIPAMISERARGLIRIVKYWGPCNVGVTERCCYNRCLAEAHDLADQLNAEQQEAA